MDEISLRQKNSRIPHFFTLLHFFSALLCVFALKSTAVFRFMEVVLPDLHLCNVLTVIDFEERSEAWKHWCGVGRTDMRVIFSNGSYQSAEFRLNIHLTLSVSRTSRLLVLLSVSMHGEW